MADYHRTPRWGVFAAVWFRRDSPLSSIERLVLAVISMRCHKDDKMSYPALSTIAAEADLDERTVRRAVKRLGDLGKAFNHARAIEVITYPGRPSCYRVLHMDWNQADGVPWVTAHPGHTARGRRNSSRTPGTRPGTPGTRPGDPGQPCSAVKGLNTVVNTKLNTGSGGQAVRASAQGAPRTAAPDQQFAPNTRSPEVIRSRWNVPCLGCGAILNRRDGDPDVHIGACVFAGRGDPDRYLAPGTTDQ